MLYQLIKMLVTTYLRLVLTIRVRGVENIPKNGSAILISNHPSTLDGFLILSVIERKFYVFVKSRFFKEKIRHWGLKLLKALPVDSGMDNRMSLIEAEEKLYEKNLLLIFPEGNVNDGNDLFQFKISFVHLAVKAKVPIIPIVIFGSHIVMESKRIFPNRGKIYINILQPINLDSNLYTPDKNNMEEDAKAIRGIMIENLEKLKRKS